MHYSDFKLKNMADSYRRVNTQGCIVKSNRVLGIGDFAQVGGHIHQSVSLFIGFDSQIHDLIRDFTGLTDDIPHFCYQGGVAEDLE